MKRILIVQPSLQPPGGGNVVAAWMIEALKRDHAVSVLTWRAINLDEINRYCGTSLRPADFKPLRVGAALRTLFDLIPIPLSLLKTNLLLRAAKNIVQDYELAISVNNEANLGRRGIQYDPQIRPTICWMRCLLSPCCSPIDPSVSPRRRASMIP